MVVKVENNSNVNKLISFLKFFIMSFIIIISFELIYRYFSNYYSIGIFYYSFFFALFFTVSFYWIHQIILKKKGLRQTNFKNFTPYEETIIISELSLDEISNKIKESFNIKKLKEQGDTLEIVAKGTTLLKFDYSVGEMIKIKKEGSNKYYISSKSNFLAAADSGNNQENIKKIESMLK